MYAYSNQLKNKQIIAGDNSILQYPSFNIPGPLTYSIYTNISDLENTRDKFFEYDNENKLIDMY